LAKDVSRLYDLAVQDDHASVERNATVIAKHILSTPPSPVLLHEIESALRGFELKTAPDGVIFRSSALAEDNELQTAAGCYTSIAPRSTDRIALADALVGCWASGFGAPALSYAFTGSDRTHLSHPHRMGVVVQSLVRGDISGVCFTTHPTPRNAADKYLVVLEVVHGGCAPLVSGHVQPTAYVIDTLADEVVESRRGGSGPDPLAPSEAVALATHFVRLASALEIETPFDFEWTRRAGQVFVLQARPLAGAVR